MNSAKRAKERLKKTLAESLEPYSDMLSPYDIRCDLERQVQVLKQELATTQEQLRETQITNANWQERFTEQAKSIDQINAGRQMDVDQWCGKLAKANIENDRLEREAHNAKAFDESHKEEAKRWRRVNTKTKQYLAAKSDNLTELQKAARILVELGGYVDDSPEIRTLRELTWTEEDEEARLEDGK